MVFKTGELEFHEFLKITVIHWVNKADVGKTLQLDVLILANEIISKEGLLN